MIGYGGRVKFSELLLTLPPDILEFAPKFVLALRSAINFAVVTDDK